MRFSHRGLKVPRSVIPKQVILSQTCAFAWCSVIHTVTVLGQYVLSNPYEVVHLLSPGARLASTARRLQMYHYISDAKSIASVVIQHDSGNVSTYDVLHYTANV